MHKIIEKKRQRKRQVRIRLILLVGVILCSVGIIFMNLYKENKAVDKKISNERELAMEPVEEIFVTMEGVSQEGIPTGCESVSTVAVLRYLGVAITSEEFIENYLPCKAFWYENGELHGPNPHEYFAGNPFETSSLGCFSKVIVKAVEEMKRQGFSGTIDLKIENVTGTSLDMLAKTYLKQEIPVIVWVTNEMLPSYKGTEYLLEDGSRYEWTSREHCMVLCGMDGESYYLMDPLAAGEMVKYDRELVECRYEEMGREAVVIYRQQ